MSDVVICQETGTGNFAAVYVNGERALFTTSEKEDISFREMLELKTKRKFDLDDATIQQVYTTQIEELGDYPPELATLVKVYENIPYEIAAATTTEEQATSVARVLSQSDDSEFDPDDQNGDMVRIIVKSRTNGWEPILIGPSGSVSVDEDAHEQ